MKKFFDSKSGKNIRQIRKDVARKLYEKYETVYFQSSNMPFNSFFQSACPINKERENYGENFDTICNEFQYYNCDNERGRYIHFFVEE